MPDPAGYKGNDVSVEIATAGPVGHLDFKLFAKVKRSHFRSLKNGAAQERLEGAGHQKALVLMMAY